MVASVRMGLKVPHPAHPSDSRATCIGWQSWGREAWDRVGRGGEGLEGMGKEEG